MESLYRVEYSRNGHGCRHCHSTIKQGQLAIAAMIQVNSFGYQKAGNILTFCLFLQSFHHDGKDAHWFHKDCFFIKHRPRSTDEIEYFENIRYEDQNTIQKKVSSFNAILVPESSGIGKKRKTPSMGPLSDFGVEYSKSGRAQCVGCRNKIMKEELRVKKTVYHTEVGKDLLMGILALDSK